MKRRSPGSLAICLLLLLFLFGILEVIASANRVHENNNNNNNNNGSSSLYWSTAKDEVDLLTKPQAQQEDDSDSDGGFSSLEGMLQWAIGISIYDCLFFYTIFFPILLLIIIIGSLSYAPSVTEFFCLICALKWSFSSFNLEGFSLLLLF